ncbi:DUF742 domain-containing protein [Streptomyces sp. TRM49041]|uniref:DUF742 domain-containing protein n=1 Tax=Streptomyces sp. TRM49041 TaxID=2603216 RepID=UPI0011EDEE97|nr:DUF742 domain-containing protein [Streptomyces sp. TRM49041]
MTGSAGAGPVRPYVITGGRVEPTRNTLALETLVAAISDSPEQGLGPEAMVILSLCQGLLSVAEVAAHLRQPITVVKVLLADLIDAGLILARPPIPVADHPDKALLREVLDGLRRL